MVSESIEAELIDESALSDDGLIAAWCRLAEMRENPFLTPEWFKAWLWANPDEEPFAIAWRVGGELRGVLPLIRIAKGPAGLLRFAGARRGDWFTPACSVEDEPAMATACAKLLQRERHAWQLLRLDRIDRASAWPQALWDAGVEGSIAPARLRRSDVLPFIHFGEGGYAGYLAGRSRNFRSHLGRRRRKLERKHGLAFRMTSDPDQLDADFTAFFRLHEERWRARGGSSSGSERVQQFHREFAAAALRHGWLRLWTAEADGVPAAAWYGWRIGGRYCYSLSGLSGRYESLSLGTVLLAHTIEQAAAEGARVYDLMWGGEAYKRRFETGCRDADTWVLGRRRHPFQLAASARTALESQMRDARGG